MNVLENIKNGVYQTKYKLPVYPGNTTPAKKEKFKQDRLNWNEDTYRLQQKLFRQDLAEEFGMSDHPKEEKVWDDAWASSHYAGLEEVYEKYKELAAIATCTS